MTYISRGIATRSLSTRERPWPAVDTATPLVVEAETRGARLEHLLAAHTDQIMTGLFEHGAVLFRNFAVDSEHDFATALSSLRGAQTMAGYLLIEPGRDRVGDAPGVFGTNAYFKTGGGFNLGGFHAEGYPTPDAPGVLGFWCKQASWIGGETGLMHMANAYAELSDGCRARLESGGPCIAQLAPLARAAEVIGRTYRLSLAEAEARLIELGLTVELDGKRWFGFHKPSVCVHPHTGRPSLQIHLSELPGIDDLIRANLAPHYTGARWFLHRRVWTDPRFEAVAEHYEAWECLLALARSQPRVFARRVGPQLRKLVARKPAPAPAPPPASSGAGAAPAVVTTATKLTRQDIEEIAAAACRHCSAFRWQRGDVLLIDNLQMAHAGLPGYGPRALRVMMLNPIPFRYPVASPVMHVPAHAGEHRLLVTQLEGRA